MGLAIAKVATAQGRSVQLVAAEPFALTLWTCLQLQQVQHVEAVEAEQNRYDLAGLIAHALNDPEKLATMHAAFLATITAASLTASRESALERARRLVADHQKLVPATAPEEAP